MKLNDVKLLYILFCVVLGVIILSPTLVAVIAFPKGESFSELWLLGPNHMIQNGAFNVSANKPYVNYLGVTNHVGEVNYYVVYVKFRSSSEALSEMEDEQPSPLQPVFQYRLFLQNNVSWEQIFEFSLMDVLFEGNNAQVTKLSINGNDVNVNKTAAWDGTKGGFFCQFLFELWRYDIASSAFKFDNRSVWFWFNITKTS